MSPVVGNKIEGWRRFEGQRCRADRATEPPTPPAAWQTCGLPITNPSGGWSHPGWLDYTAQQATLSPKTVLTGAYGEGTLEVVLECTTQMFHLGAEAGGSIEVKGHVDIVNDWLHVRRDPLVLPKT